MEVIHPNLIKYCRYSVRVVRLESSRFVNQGNRNNYCDAFIKICPSIAELIRSTLRSSYKIRIFLYFNLSESNKLFSDINFFFFLRYGRLQYCLNPSVQYCLSSKLQYCSNPSLQYCCDVPTKGCANCLAAIVH